MNRIDAVREALAGRKEPVYLEIGVSKGTAFKRISAAEKIAVDPAFQISDRTRRKADQKAETTHYFETTSDAFFTEQASFLEQRGIDVALIDGLHTYQQVVRDVDNALRHLRQDGVLVLHDCNPAAASIGFPASSYADFYAKNSWWKALRGWSGDVWKSIVHLRTRPDLRVAVLDCDYGVGLVRKGTPEAHLEMTPGQVDALTYADLEADRQRLLNLKPPQHLHEFLSSGQPALDR